MRQGRFARGVGQQIVVDERHVGQARSTLVRQQLGRQHAQHARRRAEVLAVDLDAPFAQPVEQVVGELDLGVGAVLRGERGECGPQDCADVLGEAFWRLLGVDRGEQAA